MTASVDVEEAGRAFRAVLAPRTDPADLDLLVSVLARGLIHLSERAAAARARYPKVNHETHRALQRLGAAMAEAGQLLDRPEVGRYVAVCVLGDAQPEFSASVARLQARLTRLPPWRGHRRKRLSEGALRFAEFAARALAVVDAQRAPGWRERGVLLASTSVRGPLARVAAVAFDALGEPPKDLSNVLKDVVPHARAWAGHYCRPVAARPTILPPGVPRAGLGAGLLAELMELPRKGR